MICPVTGTRCESTGCTVYIDGRCGMLTTTPTRGAEETRTPETDAAIARVAKMWPAQHHDDPRNKLGYYIDMVHELQELSFSLERRLATLQGELEEARRERTAAEARCAFYEHELKITEDALRICALSAAAEREGGETDKEKS